MVTAFGHGTRRLSVGQRVFGLTDSYRGGGLTEFAAIESRNLVPLPGDVDFTVDASLAMPGPTACQGGLNTSVMRRPPSKCSQRPRECSPRPRSGPDQGATAIITSLTAAELNNWQ